MTCGDKRKFESLGEWFDPDLVHRWDFAFRLSSDKVKVAVVASGAAKIKLYCFSEENLELKELRGSEEVVRSLRDENCSGYHFMPPAYIINGHTFFFSQSCRTVVIHGTRVHTLSLPPIAGEVESIGD